MLKYFVDTAEGLLGISLLTGMILGYMALRYGTKGKTGGAAAAAAGIIAAFVMAHMKNTTNKINNIVTAQWNLRIFRCYVIAAAAFFLLILLIKVIPFGDTVKKRLDILPVAALGFTGASALFYALPDIISYVYEIYMVEKTVFSTDFLLKTIGFILAVIFMLVLVLVLKSSIERLGRGTGLFIASLAVLVYGFRCVMAGLRIMLSQRLIRSTPGLFKAITFVYNHDRWIVYALMILAVTVFAVLWIMSFRQNEPYSNPAEHRKIRFKWRVTRRRATAVFCCIVLAVVNYTVFDPLANKVIELSPVEDVQAADGNVRVPFEMVEDGHLHRFGYTAPSGIKVRFIVIKKPNSSSYGVGLDACDICGETGYFERDGQVVCKLCDVVMNINTIGFKGGCNPIVIDYSIENGAIVIPATVLVEHENTFKNNRMG